MGKEMRYYYNAEHGVQFVRYASRTLSTHNSFVVVNGGAGGNRERGRSVFRAANLELAYRWQKVTGCPNCPLRSSRVRNSAVEFHSSLGAFVAG